MSDQATEPVVVPEPTPVDPTVAVAPTEVAVSTEPPPASPPPPEVFVPDPVPEPKPEVDLATKIIRVSEEYQARLVALKAGLFKPTDLLNPGWSYISAISPDDRTFIGQRIAGGFKELEDNLLTEMSKKIQDLLVR